MAIRQFTAEALRDLGYTVLEAQSGGTAESLVRGTQPIDLIVSDVVMPGRLSDINIAEIAQRLRPDTKVILASGYTAEIHGNRDLSQVGEFLAQPYRTSALAKRIRAILDRR